METFLEELSSAAPVPGGGSVAALEVAMAAALLAMVANLTVGRKRYAHVQSQVMDARERATTLCHSAAALVHEDTQAYGRVADALALPRATDEERAERQRQVQEALKGAVGPPLRTMQVAVEVARLAGELVDTGNASAVSDVGTAVLAARASFAAGRLNVAINLSAIRDAEWTAGVRETLESFPDLDTLETVVMGRVESIIAGGGA